MQLSRAQAAAMVLNYSLEPDDVVDALMTWLMINLMGLDSKLSFCKCQIIDWIIKYSGSCLLFGELL